MITEFLTQNLIDAEIIKDDNKEIVHYGIYGLLSTLFNFATILFIGVCCNCVLESILFTIAFYFLRIYAGGYHADTPKKCYFFSVGISIFNFLILRNLSGMLVYKYFICDLQYITCHWYYEK